MAATDDDNLVCPHCIAPVGRFDHFCPVCGGPVTAHASNDPLGQVFAAGRAYQRASEAPRPIAVIGLWLIFGPQVPVLVFALFLTMSSLFAPGQATLFGTPVSDRGFLELLRAVVMAGLLALYVAILWKVTARYARSCRRADTGGRGFPVVPLDESGKR